MTEMRYLIVTYRRSVAADYFRPRLQGASEFDQYYCVSHDHAEDQLELVLLQAAAEKLDREYGERNTYLYVNGFGPDPSGEEGDDNEEFLAHHEISEIWSAAVKRAEIEIQARAKKIADAKIAREKADAERARASAAQEIERLKKLHGLT